MDHEVIIVGAGPAGSSAAIVLASTGRDVLLVDQHDFPRPKTCGDAVTPAGVKILHELGLKDGLRKARFRSIDRVRLVSPGNRVLDLRILPKNPEMTEMIAPRFLLDDLMKRHAVECGASFLRARAAGLVMKNGLVQGIRVRTGERTLELNSRVVIGADGSGSSIAAGLGEGRWNQDDAVAIRAYAHPVKIIPETAEIHLTRELWPGYAWIFPAGGNRVNVGLGISIRGYLRMKQSLRSLLRDFLNSPGIRERFGGDAALEEIKAGGLRYYSRERSRRAFDGALLAGDAAALVNPWNGGGIVNALESGRIAAAVIDRALAENDVSRRRLKEYESLLASSVLGELKACHWMKKWLYSPPAAEAVIRFIEMNRTVARIASRFYRDITVDVL
jgi:menaquinone-9 beta-reductase